MLCVRSRCLVNQTSDNDRSRATPVTVTEETLTLPSNISVIYLL